MLIFAWSYGEIRLIQNRTGNETRYEEDARFLADEFPSDIFFYADLC